MKTLVLIMVLGLLASAATAQPFNPANPPIWCEYVPDSTGRQTLDEITGAAREQDSIRHILQTRSAGEELVAFWLA